MVLGQRLEKPKEKQCFWPSLARPALTRARPGPGLALALALARPCPGACLASPAPGPSLGLPWSPGPALGQSLAQPWARPACDQVFRNYI